MPAAIIIPARFTSTRFPGKALATLYGKPLIQHVYERCVKSSMASEVLVATDSVEIFQAVATFGGKAVMTSSEHASGTDRVAEAASKTGYDIIVNVQGDEPMTRPETVDTAIRLLEDDRASIGTVAVRITRDEDVLDPNAVKVAFDEEGFALYFSRAPIPYHRELWKSPQGATAIGAEVYKHIGIYSYRKETLMRFSALRESSLERIEKLEQLRAIENGMRIKVGITEFETLGVDTPDDLERVRKTFEP